MPSMRKRKKSLSRDRLELVKAVRVMTTWFPVDLKPLPNLWDDQKFQNILNRPMAGLVSVNDIQLEGFTKLEQGLPGISGLSFSQTYQGEKHLQIQDALGRAEGAIDLTQLTMEQIPLVQSSRRHHQISEDFAQRVMDSCMELAKSGKVSDGSVAANGPHIPTSW